MKVCNNIIKKKIKIRIETMNIREKSKNIELIKEKKFDKIFDRFYYSFTFLFLFQIFFYFFIFFFFFL